MLYAYKSKSLTGDILTGTIEADSTVAAQQMLRKQGQLLLQISKSRKGSFAESVLRLSGKKRVPKRELLMLTSQLGEKSGPKKGRPKRWSMWKCEKSSSTRRSRTRRRQES